MTLSWKKFGTLLIALTLLSATTVQAQTLASENDPQARVGRVSLIMGSVSWRMGDENTWSSAVLNYPVTSGNVFWADPDARAEIRVGADSIRLDSATELTVLQLDDRALRVNVSQGTINLHVESHDPDETYEVVTPRGTVDLLGPGTYRINAGTEHIPTAVAVLRGSARFIGNGAFTVVAGETALASGLNAITYRITSTEPTAFDNWSLARDNYEEPRQVVKYVSPEMTGYEDLDNYGTWQPVPEYGDVWIPASVPVDWAPYRYGHWAWIEPWGWTWIDDAPWGFAPFHYGRWIVINHRWCWWPGKRVHRPVYAPALVVFVGGSNWNISIFEKNKRDRHWGRDRDHHIGWFPLGPHEPYRPGYHASDRYIREVNANAIKDLPNHESRKNGDRYLNRAHATIVPQKDFSSSRDISRVSVPVPSQALNDVPVIGSTPPVQAPPSFRHPVETNDTPKTAATPDIVERGGKKMPFVRFPQHQQTQIETETETETAPAPDQTARPLVMKIQPPNRTMTPPVASSSQEPSHPVVQTTASQVTEPPAIRRFRKTSPEPVQERRVIMPTETPSAPVPQVATPTPAVMPVTSSPRRMGGGLAPAPVPAQPHEIVVPRSVEPANLTPSQQGWIRSAPQTSPQVQRPAQPAKRAKSEREEKKPDEQKPDRPVEHRGGR